MNKKHIISFVLSIVLIALPALDIFAHTDNWKTQSTASNCGKWTIDDTLTGKDKRISIIPYGEVTEDCSSKYRLDNKTGILSLGAYSFELSTATNNANISSINPYNNLLLPELSLNIQVTPADISKSARITIRGGISNISLATDTSLFILKSIIDSVPVTTSCIISYPQITFLAMKTGNVFIDSAKMVLAGHISEAIAEISNVLDEFKGKVLESSAELGIGCFTDALKKVFGLPIVRAKMLVTLTGWFANVIFAYLNYQGHPIVLTLIYNPPVPTITSTWTPSHTSIPSSTPTLSPNNALIAFIHDYNLWLMQADGSNKKQITFDGTLGTDPKTSPELSYSGLKWSLDGKYLLVLRIRLLTQKSLVLINLSDFSIRTLLDSLGGYAWSPNGQKVIFTEASFVSAPPGGISVYDLQAGTKTTLVRPIENQDYYDPRFSNDGRKISFSVEELTSDGTYYYKTVIHDLQSSAEAILDNAAGCTWSPDSQKLACLIEENGTPCNHLVLFDVSGNRLSDISYSANSCIVHYSPAWSPTGNTIAYERSSEQDVYPKIVIISPDGGNPWTLDRGMPIYGPQWSPDGLFLTYSAEGVPEEYQNVYKLQINGKQLTTLTDDLTSSCCAVWQP